MTFRLSLRDVVRVIKKIIRIIRDEQRDYGTEDGKHKPDPKTGQG